MKKTAYILILFLVVTFTFTSCGSFMPDEFDKTQEYGTSEKPWIKDAYTGTQGVLALDQLNLTPECKLMVYGKKVDGDVPMYFNEDPFYVLVPFTKVLEVMGADVVWTSDTQADIRLNGKNYVLNTCAETSEELLFDVETESFLSVSTPGDTVRYQAIENELLLNKVSVTTALMMMDVDITAKADPWKNTLRIEEKTK